MNTDQLMLLLNPLQANRKRAENATAGQPEKDVPGTSFSPAGDSDAGVILPLILILLADGSNPGMIPALLYILM